MQGSLSTRAQSMSHSCIQSVACICSHLMSLVHKSGRWCLGAKGAGNRQEDHDAHLQSKDLLAAHQQQCPCAAVLRCALLCRGWPPRE